MKNIATNVNAGNGTNINKVKSFTLTKYGIKMTPKNKVEKLDTMSHNVCNNFSEFSMFALLNKSFRGETMRMLYLPKEIDFT